MEDNKLPTALQMMKNFSKELVTFVKKGMPNVSEEDYQERLDDCFNCEHFLENLNRCGKCGCLVEYKARWKTTKCPIGVWKQQIVGEGGTSLEGKIKRNEENKEGDNTDTSDKV